MVPRCSLSIASLQDDTLGHVISFLNEDEVYHLEDAFPTNVRILAATERQWDRFAQLDEYRRGNTRWPTSGASRPHHCTSSSNLSSSSSLSRRRGRDYVEARRFTKQLSNESNRLYDFDSQPVPYFYPVPCRRDDGNVKKGTTTTGSSQQPQSDPPLSPCWEQEWASWTAGNGDVDSTNGGRRDVFLNLTVRNCGKDDGRSWEGYRRVHHVSSSEIEFSLDILPLIDELRWTELRQYHHRLVQVREKVQHDDDHDAYNRYDHHQAMRQLEKIMRRLQITMTTSSNGSTSHDNDCQLYDSEGRIHQSSRKRQRRRLLMLATGGFHCMAAGSPFLDSSAYFHDRCPRRPLATSIAGGPYTSCMTISADDRLVFKLARASMED